MAQVVFMDWGDYMVLLMAFAFLAGVVTVLSPCILPLLPIILSSADGTGRQKPIGVVLGFISSFTFFTLFLSSLVRWSGIPADALRGISIIVLAVFGASLLIPQIQTQLEVLFSKLAVLTPNTQTKNSLLGGVVIGLSLGLLWTPCVGPILASVITLALTGSVSAQAFFITLAYAAGTAVPMLGIMLAGSTALQRVPWLVKNTAKIQQVFGVLMLVTALGILANVDRQFQTWVLTAFPQYGVGLTKFEELAPLNQLGTDQSSQKLVGKSLSNVVSEMGPLAPELVLGGQWFNSEPLQLSALKGKVVLVDFWTYSCINCQRTLPYLKSWWQKYRDSGLVVIGVHSPEFEFEKVPANVQKALGDFGVMYPVMQDNNFATWRAYHNNYWPAKYLIDKDGRVRYTHFGEGKYDETEAAIQVLLKETGATMSAQPITNPEYQIYSRTPELYLGYSRLEYLDSPERVVKDAANEYTVPTNLSPNTFGYQGEWTIMPEYAAPAAGGVLELDFEAKEVYLVARPKQGSGTMSVLLDGELQAFGADNHEGVVTVDADRLYKLIQLPTAGHHRLRLQFNDSNIEVFAFTFG